jgi:hypothetical protein
MTKHLAQPIDPASQQPTRTVHTADRGSEFGPWLTSDEGRRYVGNRTMKGFYEWCRRNGITPVRRRYLRRQIDHVLTTPQAPRRMSPNSLANLRKRKER